VLLLVVARKRKTDLKRVHPCWFVVLSRKQTNISGHTAVLLLLVATKQKNEAGFGFCQEKRNLSGHTAVLLLVVARKQKIEAGSPLFVLGSVKKRKT
jgi:hypothetical protein